MNLLRFLNRTKSQPVEVPTSEERYALAAWEPVDRPNPEDMPPKTARNQ